MRFRHRLRLGLLFFSLTLLACGDDGRRPTDGSAGDSAQRDLGPRDEGTPDLGQCTEASQCDDGHACTLDMCGVGGVCQHTPLDERCGAGEMCSLASGCQSSCETNDDCQNGSFCDGVERCVSGECFGALRGADCNDGNACTIDACNDAAGGCEYEPAPGCDAGVPLADAGPVTLPFDPAMHYEGNFVVAPAPSLACTVEYMVPSLQFHVDGDTLVVMAESFRLTQSPVPSGAEFAVRGSDGRCASVSITGQFNNSNQLMAQWQASCSCGGTLTRDMFGERDD